MNQQANMLKIEHNLYNLPSVSMSSIAKDSIDHQFKVLQKFVLTEHVQILSCDFSLNNKG